MDQHIRTSEAATRQGFRFEVASDAAGLDPHVPDWDRLAEAALEPNCFYESWMLRPALLAFAGDARLVLVFAYLDTPGSPPVLCGFFPFEVASRYRGLPLTHLRLWRHVHFYLATPLVHRDRAHACLAALYGWLRESRGEPLVEWPWLGGDGPFVRALLAVCAERNLRVMQDQGYDRALLRPRADAETYLREAFSKKRRHEFARLERRLAEEGPVAYEAFATGGDPAPWIDAFLALEASGWKGARGSALASTDAGRDFFRLAAAGAASRGRLEVLGLRCGDRWVAMLCVFLSGEGAFAFKIAYDEARAPYSPGMLLGVEHLRRFHAHALPRWMDSCASPVHFMADRLWIDRRAIAGYLTSTGRAVGTLAVSLLPLARWFARKLRRNA